MDALKQADLEIVAWLNGWAGRFPTLDRAAEVVTGDYLIPVVLALSLLWLWFSARGPEAAANQQRTALTALTALALVNLAILVFNDLYFRPRPFTELELNLLFYSPTDSSFPANPVALAFALSASVFMRQRRLGAVLMALAALWGLSRVYAGVFYLSDVAGGAAMGVGVAWAAVYVVRWLEPVPTAVLRVARVLHLA